MNPLDQLSRRQFDVAYRIARAHTSKMIATELGMTDGNVERHVGNIARVWRLDMTRNIRVQIAAVFWEHHRKSA